MNAHRLSIIATAVLLSGEVVLGNYGRGSSDSSEHSDDQCRHRGRGPPTRWITNYISADNSINGSTTCRMEYLTPEVANLYQGMLAASQQHGNGFTFESIFFAGLGHFITAVNGIKAAPSYFWALYDADGVATSFGADSLYPTEDDAFIWNYRFYNSSDHSIPDYTGPCLNGPALPPSLPLTYEVAYLTVSSRNTAEFTNGTDFKPVCRQIVLFDPANSTLADVLATASEQVPLNISSTITHSVILTTLNDLTNQAGFVWTPFKHNGRLMLSRDLSATTVRNGDSIVFRFEEEDDEDDDVDNDDED